MFNNLLLCRKLQRFINYYFYLVVVVMILAFLDSIREGFNKLSTVN